MKSTLYLVKPLLSRNFCENSVRENFRNFHTVRKLEMGDPYCRKADTLRRHWGGFQTRLMIIDKIPRPQ